MIQMNMQTINKGDSETDYKKNERTRKNVHKKIFSKQVAVQLSSAQHSTFSITFDMAKHAEKNYV